MSGVYYNSERFAQINSVVAAAEQGVFDGFDSLVEALTNEDHEVRLKAVHHLGRIGFPTAFESIQRMAQSDFQPNNRASAIYALREIARPFVIPSIIEALCDDEDQCRSAARESLFQLIGIEVMEFISTDEWDPVDLAEVDLLREWWVTNSARFDPERCYAYGRLATPGVFIEVAKASDAALPEILYDALNVWTGQDFGESPKSIVIAQWEKWWSANSPNYKPGMRYFYGHLVPQYQVAIKKK